jgi:hypothetical protein
MQTVSLDDIQDKLPIDFLSLDTQGSELDILKGSEVSLENTVGVETEVSFRPIYEGTPLFGELSAFLSSLGFEFIRFTTLTSAAPRVLPILGRARKMHTFADALFLRSPDSVKDAVQCKKLVFAALCYGQIEYAAYCVEKFELFAKKGGQSNLPIKSWTDFVDEFVTIVREQQGALLPKVFSDMMSKEESFARFDKTSLASVRQARWVRGLANRLPQPVKSLLRRLLRIDRLVAFYAGGAPDIEELFVRAGLPDVARDLRYSRFRSLFPLGTF